MSGFSTYARGLIINATLRGVPFTPPNVSSLYLALFTADPTDAGNAGTEIVAPWYTRQPTGTWTAPDSSSMVQNTSDIGFSPVTGASVTVTHWGVFDAPTGGNMLMSKALTNAKILDANDTIVFKPGTLRATPTGGASKWLRDAIINSLLRGTAIPSIPSANIRMALFTADPGVNMANSEPAAAWYARVSATQWTAADANGLSQNNAAIIFATVTGSTVTVTHWGLFDAAAAGNPLYYATLTSPKTIDPGDELQFLIATLAIDLN